MKTTTHATTGPVPPQADLRCSIRKWHSNAEVRRLWRPLPLLLPLMLSYSCPQSFSLVRHSHTSSSCTLRRPTPRPAAYEPLAPLAAPSPNLPRRQALQRSALDHLLFATPQGRLHLPPRPCVSTWTVEVKPNSSAAQPRTASRIVNASTPPSFHLAILQRHLLKVAVQPHCFSSHRPYRLSRFPTSHHTQEYYQ